MTAAGLLALSGAALPALAQDAERPRRERQTDRAPERDRAPETDRAAQPEGDREALMEQRRQRIEQAVESGRLSRERADEMLERMEQMGEGEGARGQGAGQGAGQDALPAQIGKLVELRDAQQSEINQLVRELRQKQMRALREIGTELGFEGGTGAGQRDGAPGGRRGAAQGEDAPETDRAPARPQRDRAGTDRPQRGAPEEGERPQRRASDDDGPLGGPEVNDRGGRGQRGGAMGANSDRAGGMGGFASGIAKMSDEEKAKAMTLIREKLGPTQREFAADLREILDEDQTATLREHWEELDTLPPMLNRLRDDVRKAREAKEKDEGESAGESDEPRRGAAGRGGRRGEAEGTERAPRERPQRGRRGGNTDDSDDPGS